MSKSSTRGERRHFQRIHFDCQAFVKRESDSAAKVQLLDISLNGALVGKPAGWSAAVGSEVRLLIELGSEDDEIRMDCTVAHLSNNCIGLHCTHMDIDSAAHLRRIVELNLGDPELLNRELTALGN